MASTRVIPDGSGIMSEGTVGGDGALESVSVRYHVEDKPGAIITAYYYVMDLLACDELDCANACGATLADEDETLPNCTDERGHRFYRYTVEEMTTFTVCTDPADPGSTELWSDLDYGEGSYMAYETEERAEAERDRMIRCESADYYTWDGAPF